MIEQEDQFDEEGLTADDMGRRGQILWIRGLTRLQHQVSARMQGMPQCAVVCWVGRGSTPGSIWFASLSCMLPFP